MNEVNNHGPLGSCNFSHMSFISEQQKGAVSVFTFKCNMCRIDKKISTAEKTHQPSSELELNKTLVLAAISVGTGYSQLQQQLAILNIPGFSQRRYQKCQEEVSEKILETSLECMVAAGREESELARQVGDVDKDGYPLISVIADGAWSKRSYKTDYSALSGVGCIVGARTGKLLYIGVRNKYYVICAKSDDVNPASEHVCSKNWKGTSTSMESDIIVERFQQSIAMHGLKYVKLVGDGDSSVMKKLLAVKPYGPQQLVRKIECTNHLLRNYVSKLYQLAKNRLSSENTVVPFKLRKVVKSKIERMRDGIRKAIQYRKTEDCSLEEQLNRLSKDIRNCPRHIFGDHGNCETYFCTGSKVEENLVPEMEDCGLLVDIFSCGNRLIQNIHSLLLNMNNNAAETYNSVVNKFIGGKRINFSIKGKYTKIYMGRINRRSKKIRSRRRLFPDAGSKHRQHRKKNAGPDSDYGNVESDDEGNSTVDFEQYKEDQMRNLFNKSSEEVARIERETIGQDSNFRWFEERALRLTASNFSSVVTRRDTDTWDVLAKRMVECPFKGDQHTRWGNAHESMARKSFEEYSKLEVAECGLFIDKQYQYLGASPDGLINDDAIIEIKCPSSIKNNFNQTKRKLRKLELSHDIQIPDAEENKDVPKRIRRKAKQMLMSETESESENHNATKDFGGIRYPL
ncbi:exonuclease phage-type/recb c-terminal domain-containing protein [Holotrichia oblita]|uniref:Exonuclease phage-type/recb c-terminal domain-containing protein n=1 Tax=Holotrichia oblita TaxID=644536 RepID=A0ACB9SME8_HOLOL|nr:exonuclease phage-type/recb c-terminal domain-containing protein [Holotrichia oblita]